MLKQKSLLKTIVINGVIAGLYVALVFAFGFMSYNYIQLRIAEVLILLCFFNRKYIVGCVIGCFIANLIGPFGMVDAIIGSAATLIACLGVAYSKKIWQAIYIVPLANILVVFELFYFEGLFDQWRTGHAILIFFSVLIGEFIVIACMGLPLFKVVQKNDVIMDFIKDQEK